jgi:outer membrane murein-binding lipoprotein Lpp
MKHVCLSLLLFAVSCTAGRQLLGASDSDTQPSNAELLKQVQALAAKVDQLETKLARYEKSSSTPPAEGPKNDIRNISGATLSSRHVTEGIKRVLATYEVCLKR